MASGEAARASRRVVRGLVLHDRALMQQLRGLMAPSTAASLRAYAADWILIALAATGSWEAFVWLGVGPLTLALYAAAALAIASRQKGFDNLVHEASHHSLSPDRRLNDLMCYALGGMWLHPTLSLAAQRAAHVAGHHGHFWDAERDPKRAGHRNLGLDQLPQPSSPRAIAVLVRAYGRAHRWHLLSIVSGRFLANYRDDQPLVARTLVVAAVGAGFVGAGLGLPVVLYWVLPALVALPLVSFVAQVGEHAATTGVTEFEQSRNCLGVIPWLLCHAHGDGYHVVHHLFPRIPHHQLARAHRLLLADPRYREGNHVHGFGVLATHRRGLWNDFVRPAITAPP